MVQNPEKSSAAIPLWQRNLLISGAVFTVLLIAMGGILCVTQSIRNCPDWPGCFGSVIPPLETGPVLEYTHRLLAAVSGLLILSAAISGAVRKPNIGWLSLTPWVAIVLLLLVSFFGAQVVLRGLSPGWAAVDVGSALLVVALMVVSATIASTVRGFPAQGRTLKFTTSLSKLSAAATAAIYIVLLSGVLVAGKGSTSGCLGWPVYSLAQFRLDGHYTSNALRLILSLAGLGLVLSALVQAWRERSSRPVNFMVARWLGVALLLELLVQGAMLGMGLQLPLMIIYTVTAAFLWALLVAFTTLSSLAASLA